MHRLLKFVISSSLLSFVFTCTIQAAQNNGTIHGAKWVKGRYGYALEFDGRDDYVDLDNIATRLDDDATGTISLWVKHERLGSNPADTQGLFAFYKDGTNRGKLQVDRNDHKYAFGMNIGGSWDINFKSDNATDTGNWHHVVITQDGTISRMYVDGNVQAATDSGEWLDDIGALSRVEIGRIASQNAMETDGIIDEVRIYNRALSASEVKSRYQYNTDFRNGLVAEWKFDEGRGNIAYDTHAKPAIKPQEKKRVAYGRPEIIVTAEKEIEETLEEVAVKEVQPEQKSQSPFITFFIETPETYARKVKKSAEVLKKYGTNRAMVEFIKKKRREAPLAPRLTFAGYCLLILVIGILLLVIWVVARKKRPKVLAKSEPGIRPATQTIISTTESSREAKPLIVNKYELIREMGRGGMGIVYEAVNKQLDKKVAIKKMREEVSLNPREKKKFLREAKISAKLHHSNIVDIYDIIEEDGVVYLVFEYVNGKTLEEILNERQKLNVKESIDVILQVCKALQFAHNERIVHRDLKPSNIMITSDNSFKVMDFGIAREAKNTVSRVSGGKDTSGTLAYMAPEQELGTYDAKADIFSLGVCLYEMLTGELPFKGPNFYLQKEKMTYRKIREINPEIPQEIESIIDKCLQADKEKRYTSTQGLMEEWKDI